MTLTEARAILASLSSVCQLCHTYGPTVRLIGSAMRCPDCAAHA